MTSLLAAVSPASSRRRSCPALRCVGSLPPYLVLSPVTSPPASDPLVVVPALSVDCVAGEMVTKQPLIRSMRTVKRETLKLISGWVSRSNDPQMVSSCSETWRRHSEPRDHTRRSGCRRRVPPSAQLLVCTHKLSASRSGKTLSRLCWTPSSSTTSAMSLPPVSPRSSAPWQPSSTSWGDTSPARSRRSLTLCSSAP